MITPFLPWPSRNAWILVGPLKALSLRLFSQVSGQKIKNRNRPFSIQKVGILIGTFRNPGTPVQMAQILTKKGFQGSWSVLLWQCSNKMKSDVALTMHTMVALLLHSHCDVYSWTWWYISWWALSTTTTTLHSAFHHIHIDLILSLIASCSQSFGGHRSKTWTRNLKMGKKCQRQLFFCFRV